MTNLPYFTWADDAKTLPELEQELLKYYQGIPTTEILALNKIAECFCASYTTYDLDGVNKALANLVKLGYLVPDDHGNKYYLHIEDDFPVNEELINSDFIFEVVYLNGAYLIALKQNSESLGVYYGVDGKLFLITSRATLAVNYKTLREAKSVLFILRTVFNAYGADAFTLIYSNHPNHSN